MRENAYGPAYRPLLALSALFGLGALVTLVPNPGASWPNIMGYSSICTFAPGATFACALLAAIACTIRARLVRRWTAPSFVPVFAIAALGIGLAISTIAWAGVKAEYTEAVSGASAVE